MELHVHDHQDHTHLENLSEEQQIDPSEMEETRNHDVTDPGLSRDVMVDSDDEIAVSSGVELIDICTSHDQSHD